jgi:drug/metabolite transporter (DMT)-like permease
MTKAAASQLMIWTAMIIVYVVWGSTYLAIRIAVESMPPLLMAGVRFLIAGSILFVWRKVALGRTAPRLTARHWQSAALIGAGLMLGGNGGVAVAERTIPSGITALVAATVPLWIALLDRVWFKHALPVQRIAGLVIGFGAVAFLVGSPDAGTMNIFGAATAVFAAVAWAAGSLYARSADLPDDPSTAIGMEMLAGGILLVVGFSAYLWLLRVAPIARVSTYAYVNPLVAIALGWLILREPIGPHTIAAGAAILIAVALIIWEPNTKRAGDFDLTHG